MKLIHAYSRRKKNSTNYRNLLNDIRKISLNLFLKEMIALLYKYNKKKPVFTPFMVQVTKHISSLDEPAHVIFIEKLNGIADKYDALTYQWKVIIRTIRNSSAMIKKIDKFNGELTVFFKEISSRFAYFKNNLTSREDTEIAERLWEVSFNVARIYFHKVGVTSKPAKDLWSSMLLAALTFKRMINFNVPDKLFNREYNKSLEALDEIHDLLRIEPIGYMDTAKNKAVAPRPVSPFSNTAVISPQN
jgi:hypothetical protein